MRINIFVAAQSALILTILVIAGACNLEPGPAKEVQFEKSILSSSFLAEGVAVGDINRDGRRDIIAGTTWFEAPTWIRHDVAEVPVFDPETEYSETFGNFVLDVNLDGWIDIIQFAFPGTEVFWFENPGQSMGSWKRHVAFETYANESPIQADVNADGRYDLLVGDYLTRRLVWLEPPAESGKTMWNVHVISADSVDAADRFAHGLGFGDVNGDARRDVLTTAGWWEAPTDMDGGTWIYHEADWGSDVAQMYAIDADADGDQDILSSSVHDYGIWIHTQNGVPTDADAWSQSIVDESVSQTHALAVADIDNDGDDDMITGKRYFAHHGHDPGFDEPAMLVWYEHFPRAEIGERWIRHEIDNDSGAGVELVTSDINGDGRQDIVVSNKKGVFLFLQK